MDMKLCETFVNAAMGGVGGWFLWNNVGFVYRVYAKSIEAYRINVDEWLFEF